MNELGKLPNSDYSRTRSELKEYRRFQPKTLMSRIYNIRKAP
jgi:hypothetical protein